MDRIQQKLKKIKEHTEPMRVVSTAWHDRMLFLIQELKQELRSGLSDGYSKEQMLDCFEMGAVNNCIGGDTFEEYIKSIYPLNNDGQEAIEFLNWVADTSWIANDEENGNISWIQEEGEDVATTTKELFDLFKQNKPKWIKQN